MYREYNEYVLRNTGTHYIITITYYNQPEMLLTVGFCSAQAQASERRRAVVAVCALWISMDI